MSGTNNCWNADWNVTKGSLLVGDNTRPKKINVGSDTTSLIADSSTSTGVKWGNPACSATTKFIADGTFNISADAKYVRVIAWGAGGGGGGGFNAGVGVDVFGASGGAAADVVNFYCEASVFPASSSITIGVGGAGGAPGGNPGAAGTQTLVQTNVGNIVAPGGLGGDGGSLAPPNVTQSAVGVMDFTNLFYGEGGDGFTSSPTGTASPAAISSPGFPNGGAGAGGVDNTEVEGNGELGGQIFVCTNLVLAGGVAGVAPGGAGGAGNIFTTQAYYGGGSGGGGGAGSATTNGGAGGDGGIPGGGGGGGGSCRDPNSGGEGGKGGRGEVWIIEYF